MNCLGEFFAFQYLSICDLLYLAEISHRKKIVLCLESGPTWHTMWKLLTPSPQLENKLWHFLRYFSKICPKKIKWANWAIFHNNASFEMSTIDSTAPSFQTCSILFVQKQQRAKSWFPHPRKVLLPCGWFTRTPSCAKKEFAVKRFSYCIPCWN